MIEALAHSAPFYYPRLVQQGVCIVTMIICLAFDSENRISRDELLVILFHDDFYSVFCKLFLCYCLNIIEERSVRCRLGFQIRPNCPDT